MGSGPSLGNSMSVPQTELIVLHGTLQWGAGTRPNIYTDLACAFLVPIPMHLFGEKVGSFTYTPTGKPSRFGLCQKPSDIQLSHLYRDSLKEQN